VIVDDESKHTKRDLPVTKVRVSDC
jgi:hypothetical protein